MIRGFGPRWPKPGAARRRPAGTGFEPAQLCSSAETLPGPGRTLTLILAIDTSADASAALSPMTASPCWQLRHRGTRTHAEVLAPGIDASCEAGISGDDVDGIVTGVGPGPFADCAWGSSPPAPSPLSGTTALRGDEPGRHRLGVAESTDSAAEFTSPPTRAARKSTGPGTLSDAELRSWPTARTSDRRGPPDLPVYRAGAGIYPDVVRAVAEFSTGSPRPSRWASSRSPGSRRGSSSWTPRPCTCASRTPRCPDPGSVPCERGHAAPLRLPGGITLRDMEAEDLSAVHGWNASCSPWTRGRCRCSTTNWRRRTPRLPGGGIPRPNRGLLRADVIEPIADVQTIAVIPE